MNTLLADNQDTGNAGMESSNVMVKPQLEVCTQVLNAQISAYK